MLHSWTPMTDAPRRLRLLSGFAKPESRHGGHHNQTEPPALLASSKRWKLSTQADHSGSPIVMLRNNPPTIEDPVRLYASTTDDLATVSYAADIVGWEDKPKLERARRDEVAGIIMSSQRTENGLYDAGVVYFAPNGTGAEGLGICGWAFTR